LSLIGVFDEIAGLIIGKPEFYDQQSARFGYDELFKEVLGERKYPVISNFDCGHTVPMLTVPRYSRVRLIASTDDVSVTLLDGSIEKDR
jgi:muramoyltetrapeptide carboxypeptidase